MSHSRESVSLPEEDYSAVLDFIAGMLSRNTTRSLARLFQSRLLPLLGASTCFYGWADSGVFRPWIIDAVGIPESDFSAVEAYFPRCPLARHMIERASTVESYDLDLPRRELQDSVESFFEAHPGSRFRGSSYLEEINTVLLAMDHSEPAILIGFHRINGSNESFTPRERRILDILRPHLCQTIKALIPKERMDHSAPMLDADSSESQSPMAQVTADSKIVVQNSSFKELFNSLPGDKLGLALTRFLTGAIGECDKPSKPRISETKAFWYCRCPNVFQVGVSPGNDDQWLVELHPLNDLCPAFNPVLSQYGLTPKEKEICCRVRQGFDNQEIASQLYISLHTAKTHLKNIYRKLDIPNRPRLVSFLNHE